MINMSVGRTHNNLTEKAVTAAADHWGWEREAARKRIRSLCTSDVFVLFSGLASNGKTTLAKSGTLGPIAGFERGDYAIKFSGSHTRKGASMQPELYIRHASTADEEEFTKTADVFGRLVTNVHLGAQTGQDQIVEYGLYKEWSEQMLGRSPEALALSATPNFKYGRNHIPMAPVLVLNGSFRNPGLLNSVNGSMKRQQVTLEAVLRNKPLLRGNVTVVGTHYDTLLDPQSKGYAPEMAEPDINDCKKVTELKDEVQSGYQRLLDSRPSRERYFELISPIEDFLFEDDLYEKSREDGLKEVCRRFEHEWLKRLTNDSRVVIGGEFDRNEGRIVGGEEIRYPVTFDIHGSVERRGRSKSFSPTLTMTQAKNYVSSPLLDMSLNTNPDLFEKLPSDEAYHNTNTTKVMVEGVRAIDDDILGAIGSPWITYEVMGVLYAEGGKAGEA